MKIKLIQDTLIGLANHLKDTEVEVDEGRGNYLIDKGAAVEVKAAEAPETVDVDESHPPL